MVVRSPNHFVRVGVLQKLDTALRDHNCDPQVVLPEMGLTPEIFLDGDTLLPIRDFARLLELCVKVSDNPYFVLHLCGIQDLSLGGNLGLLMQTASSLGEALNDLCEYAHIQAQFIRWQLRREGKLAILSVEMDGQVDTAAQRQLVVEIAVVQFYKSLMLLTNRKVLLRSVTFRAAKPKNRLPYLQYFQSTVQFGTEADSLVFSLKDLGREVLHTNKMLHDVVRNQVKQSGLYQAGRSLPQQVRSVIRDLLPDNKCSIEAVVRSIGCDKRTLQRHLKNKFDTSYQELLDEVRYDLACLYLKETTMPLGQLTYILGFTDPGNMSRAFTKKFGCSPKQWRLRDQGRA